jgi:hypothetical protein
MTVAWTVGPALAGVYALLVLRGETVLLRCWDRRHRHPDGN